MRFLFRLQTGLQTSLPTRCKVPDELLTTHIGMSPWQQITLVRRGLTSRYVPAYSSLGRAGGGGGRHGGRPWPSRHRLDGAGRPDQPAVGGCFSADPARPFTPCACTGGADAYRLPALLGAHSSRRTGVPALRGKCGGIGLAGAGRFSGPRFRIHVGRPLHYWRQAQGQIQRRHSVRVVECYDGGQSAGSVLHIGADIIPRAAFVLANA